MKRIYLLLIVALFIVGCGGEEAAEPTAVVEAPTAEAEVVPTVVVPTDTAVPLEPTVTAVSPTEIPPTEAPPTEVPPTETPVPIVIGAPNEDGSIPVLVDGNQLKPLFDSFMPGDDPFYLIHTQQEDIFIGVELYTVFGDSWTGELGTFPTDCTTHGICVYLDPDGTGPLVGGGPGEGTITIVQLEDSSIVILDDIAIFAENGQVYTLSGITLSG